MKSRNQWRSRIAITIITICALFGSGSAMSFAATGVNVDCHTQNEIRACFEKIYAENDFKVSYKAAPVIVGPGYEAGRLSDETLKGAIDMLNGMRYIAGVPCDVQLREDYIQMCQAGALVNAANNAMSHRPTKPADMGNELYQLGYKGCSSSNIYWNVYDFEEAVEGWVSDEYNASGSDPGHRRWCLNPAMAYTGFGKVGAYSLMYSFDKGFQNSSYTAVAWPAQQMPTDFFNGQTQWSISFGRQLDASAISVLLTRKSDQKTWSFNNRSADGDFLVSNAGYGQKGCVVFKPKEVKAYKEEDVYHVAVRENGNLIADYDVNFFDLVKKPAKVNIKAISTGKSHYVKATWRKTQSDGYQIRYSTSNAFKTYKNILVKNGDTTSKTITKLKKGKTYYVKLRAYKNGHRGRVYGDFGSVKKITCK